MVSAKIVKEFFALILTPHPAYYSEVACVIILFLELKVNVLVAQSCLTLFDPMDYSSPGSSVCGIL